MINKQINDAQQQITQLQHDVTNVEAEITQRKNQHIADQQRLEQQFNVDLQQLESRRAQLLG